MDKHLDELEDLVRISKDSGILAVAAGTGLSGQRVGKTSPKFNREL